MFLSAPLLPSERPRERGPRFHTGREKIRPIAWTNIGEISRANAISRDFPLDAKYISANKA